MSDKLAVDNSIAVSLVAYDGYDLATALQSISRLGFQAVELAQIAGNSETFDERNLDRSHAEQARDLLARYGLVCRCLSAHMDLSSPDAVAAMQRRLAYAEIVGAQYVATKSAPAERRTQLVENLHRMAKLAAAAGITILLENPSAGSGDVVDDGMSGAVFIDEMALDNVRFNYDFGNLMSRHQGRVRPEEDCLPALPYCAHLHIKDVRRTEDGWVHTAIGQGDIDYGTIMALLRGLDTPPLLSIEAPLRMAREPDGTPYPPLMPPRLGEVEQVLKASMVFLLERW